MRFTVINNIEVSISGDEISAEELSIYLSGVQSKKKYKIIKAAVTVDGENVGINCTFQHVPFERIRRTTGYLVGTTAKWCNSKRAEEHDRVKHD